jgi:hypothetical protein
MIRQRFGPMPGRRGARAVADSAASRDPLRHGVRPRGAGHVGQRDLQGAVHALETLEDYRRSLVESLAYQMINARFAELSRRPDAPFLAASAGSDTFGRTSRPRASACA